MTKPHETAPSGPVPRRRLSRQELLDTAREIVTEQGYGGASVAAIAARAGISHGALYRYFPSKVELFVEVFRDVCDREFRAASRAARSCEDPLGKLDAIIENFATRALRNPRLAWALIAEPVDPAVEQVRIEYRLTYCRGVESLLRDAVARGDIPEQDTGVAAAALLGGGNEVFAGPLSPHSLSDRDPAQVILALQQLCLGALGAPRTGRSPRTVTPDLT